MLSNLPLAVTRYVNLLMSGEGLRMDTSYYPITALSCLTFLFSYKYISPFFSSYFCPGYNNLSKIKQLEWHTRTNSSAHSFFTGTLCLYILIFDTAIQEDPVRGKSSAVKFTCAIVTGYMLSDAILILRFWKEIGDFFYLFHHSAIMCAYYFVMTYNAFPWFANFRLLAELSTPFVNQRWFLDVLGYDKGSPIFVSNGIAMAIMFLLVRIMAIPPYWYKVFLIYGSPACQELGRIWYVLLSSCIILDSLNCVWFYKILRGCYKVLYRPYVSHPSHSSPTASNNKIKTG